MMSTDDGEVGVPRVLEMLWGREPPRRRGPKPAHTIRDLGAAAVRVADSEGLAAVSMGRVAAELGVTTMALYRYVDAKDELQTVMLDSAYGRPPTSTRPRAGWRSRLEAWCRASRAQLLRHPWIVQIPITEPPLTPNTLLWTEAGLQALRSTQLTEQEKLSCILLADVYVRGHVQLSTAMARATDDSELTRHQADVQYVRRLARLTDEQNYPGVRAAMLSGALEDDDDFAEEDFTFGLTTVLDGIAARIERTGRRASRPGRIHR
jgi:AcrR family transcriptional regulator